MMKLRLANPEHLIDINDLEELSYIREERRRDPHRGADAPRRPAEVRPAGPAPAGVSRRRERDRRPGRSQPRDDRRLTVPGGRRRGSLGGLHRGEGEGRDPRRRRRAGGRDGGLPRRAVHDRRGRGRAAHRGPDSASTRAAAARTKRSNAARATGRSPPRLRPCGSTAERSPMPASRSARSGSRRSMSRGPRSYCAERPRPMSCSGKRARSPRRTALRAPTAAGRSTTSGISPAFSRHAPSAVRRHAH